MEENVLVSLTNDHVYWSGGYSQCHVGNSIETYLREAVKRVPFPISIIMTKCDGFISAKNQGNINSENPLGPLNLLPSEKNIVELESIRHRATYPIIAALCTRGVERTNILYVPLDDDTFRDGLTKVLEPFPSPSWEDRKPIAFWRGAASGFERPSLRVKVATELYDHPLADVRITPWGNWEAEQRIPSHLFGSRCGIAEHLMFKYLFIIDGNCIASNHQWVFGSGSVPIMITHPENRYWFQKYLKPMVNYVPVKYDFSDLKEKLEWLRDNDEEAKKIAEAAMAFSKEVFSPEFQRKYIDEAIAAIALGTPSMLFRYHLKNCMTPSDINEHLTTFHVYAKKCTTIVECGTRDIIGSYSFASGLVGTPGNSLTMIDSYRSRLVDPFLVMCEREGVNGQFLQESNITCQPRETDMLFIDTWHVYGHLKRELAHWHAYVKKYILMHDTTVDEIRGESLRVGANIAQQVIDSGYPEEEIRMGLGPAIAEFLEEHPEWVVEKKYTNNNGLTVLARK